MTRSLLNSRFLSRAQIRLSSQHLHKALPRNSLSLRSPYLALHFDSATIPFASVFRSKVMQPILIAPERQCLKSCTQQLPYRKPVKAPPRWSLSDHACRFCFGRVLQREERGKIVEVRCAECGKAAPGAAHTVCCCGADYGALDRVLECFRNPNMTEAIPQEILVRERALSAEEIQEKSTLLKAHQ